MEHKSKDFTDLLIWQKAKLIRKAIYELCKAFPKEEKFRLSDQLIRSSRSICANIAEGHGRYHYQEFIQFCRIARGSASETINHLSCALEIGLIGQDEYDEQLKQLHIIRKMINGFIKHLKIKKNNQIS